MKEFLLYPDTPAKIETTSREAFCMKSLPQQDEAEGGLVARRTQQESRSTSWRRTGSSSGDRKQGEEKKEGNHGQSSSTAVKTEDAPEMQSQYQKDFPPPSFCRRKRMPAVLQPDNIGINPTFRFKSSTVQREAYPGWSMMKPRHAGRLRAEASGRAN